MGRNLVSALLHHETIKTTLPKAKEAARMAEKVSSKIRSSGVCTVLTIDHNIREEEYRSSTSCGCGVPNGKLNTSHPPKVKKAKDTAQSLVLGNIIRRKDPTPQTTRLPNRIHLKNRRPRTIHSTHNPPSKTLPNAL